MSEKFSIPPEIVTTIEELFPESEERRKIAFTLMHWNKNPDTSELKEIGASVNRSTSTAYLVIQAVMDSGLFTEKYGSVPLYRYSEQIRHAMSMVEQPEQPGLPELIKTPVTGLNDEETVENPLKEDEKINPELQGVNPVSTVENPNSPDLQAQVIARA